MLDQKQLSEKLKERREKEKERKILIEGGRVNILLELYLNYSESVLFILVSHYLGNCFVIIIMHFLFA